MDKKNDFFLTGGVVFFVIMSMCSKRVSASEHKKGIKDKYTANYVMSRLISTLFKIEGLKCSKKDTSHYMNCKNNGASNVIFSNPADEAFLKERFQKNIDELVSDVSVFMDEIFSRNEKVLLIRVLLYLIENDSKITDNDKLYINGNDSFIKKSELSECKEFNATYFMIGVYLFLADERFNQNIDGLKTLEYISNKERRRSLDYEKIKNSLREITVNTEDEKRQNINPIETDKTFNNIESADKIAESIIDKFTEEIVDKSSDNIAEGISDKSTEEIVNKSSEKIAESITDKFTEESIDKLTESITDKFTKKSIDKFTESITDKFTKKSIDKFTEYIKNKNTEFVIYNTKECEANTYKFIDLNYSPNIKIEKDTLYKYETLITFRKTKYPMNDVFVYFNHHKESFSGKTKKHQWNYYMINSHPLIEMQLFCRLYFKYHDENRITVLRVEIIE